MSWQGSTPLSWPCRTSSTRWTIRPILPAATARCLLSLIVFVVAVVNGFRTGFVLLPTVANVAFFPLLPHEPNSAFPPTNAPNQIKERGLGDPSCFEPDVQIDVAAGSDHFYALVYERLWDTMLPALEKVAPSARTCHPLPATSRRY